MKFRTIILVIISLITQLSFAQQFDQTKLDEYFNTLEQNDKFMGSVAVSKEGKIIKD